MTDNKKPMGERWAEYRPSKAATFWSCAVVAGVTMLVGFSWGGWVTGGTAEEMVREGRQDLAASICVQRFMAAPGASAEHAAFMEEGSWQRDDFIQNGGWAKMPELATPITGVADLCAEKLAEIEVADSAAQTQTGDQDTTTTVQ